MRYRPADDGWFQCAHMVHEFLPCSAEAGEYLPYLAKIVVGFVSPPVGEVGGSQLAGAREVVPNAAKPQGFEVQQMSRVFLGRPFAFGSPSEDGLGTIAD